MIILNQFSHLHFFVFSTVITWGRDSQKRLIYPVCHIRLSSKIFQLTEHCTLTFGMLHCLVLTKATGDTDEMRWQIVHWKGKGRTRVPRKNTTHLPSLLECFGLPLDRSQCCISVIKNISRTSMNKRRHFFIKISLAHFFLERIDVSVVCERWVERHIQRERTSSSHIFFREPGGANACNPLQTR